MFKRGILLLLIGIVLAASIHAAEIEPKVLQELENNNEVSVIVVLKDQPIAGIFSFEDTEQQRKEAIKKTQTKVLEKLRVKEKSLKITTTSSLEYDLELKHKYSIINGFSGKITQEGLDKLNKDELVQSIYFNEEKHLFLSDSIPLINADHAWNLTANGTYINGTGETVCILDTGIDYNHTALGGGWGNKVLQGYDYVNDDPSPADDHGHGTHVAGIVASTNNTYRGVAPEARLIAIKVCNAAGSCPDADVLAGMEWCIINATVYNISVISISLGGGQYTTHCDAATTANARYGNLTNMAVERNISVVIATGNTDATYTNATAGIASPACVQNSTKVTATTKSDTLASYAFRHANFTDIIAAPGSSIVSLKNGGGTQSKDGTSMSTPHVSGAAALMHQYWKLAYNQTITPEQIKVKLKITGKTVNDTLTSINFPRLNILAALQPFINFTSNNPANATTIIITSTLINITSDVNLSSAWLEWNYNNGTLTNFTMNQSTGVNFYYNMTGLTTTNYTYRVFGNDTSNTIGTSEIRTIIVDQTSPNITIYFPINNSYLNTAFYLNISLTDLQLSFSNYSITNYSNLTVQTRANISINNASSGWYDLVNISNSTFSESNFTLILFANDTLGNQATITINFWVDKTNPNITWANITPATIYNNNTVILKLNTTDNFMLTTSKI
ncbi:S8 family serine peptidase, partial [Candidatus Woesearchaeota archaeon]|nr:S8 family serine peptidase [Candidatus Woesearchaeota archaeon]